MRTRPASASSCTSLSGAGHVPRKELRLRLTYHGPSWPTTTHRRSWTLQERSRFELQEKPGQGPQRLVRQNSASEFCKLGKQAR